MRRVVWYYKELAFPHPTVDIGEQYSALIYGVGVKKAISVPFGSQYGVCFFEGHVFQPIYESVVNASNQIVSTTWWGTTNIYGSLCREVVAAKRGTTRTVYWTVKNGVKSLSSNNFTPVTVTAW